MEIVNGMGAVMDCVCDIKQVSIGQCIVHAARPRSITPTSLGFSLGIELDNVYGSKWLFNELARFVYSVSYDEVIKFKQSVVYTSNFDDLITAYPDSFTRHLRLLIDVRLCK